MKRALSVAAGVACLALSVAPRAAAQDGFFADPQEGIGYVDSDVVLRARGAFAIDQRALDRRNRRHSELRPDRLDLGLEGELRHAKLSFRLLADLRGTDTRGGLREAWVAWTPRVGLRLRGGLLPFSAGIEGSLERATLPFVAPSFVSERTHATDLGVRAELELGEGLLGVDVAGGVGEGFDAFGLRRGGGPQVSARLSSYPLRWLDASWEAGPYVFPLNGAFVSAAFGYQEEFRGNLDVGTSFRNKLFLTRRLEAEAWAFWHVGYGFDLGPFRFLHEFTRGSLLGLELPDGRKQSFSGQFSAWSASLAWRITGEPYDSRPYHQLGGLASRDFPRRPLYDVHTKAWGPGALEVALRYSNTEFDRRLATLGLTSLNLSSQEARAFDVAFTWWPWRSARLTLQVTRVIADQFPGAFDSHGRDTSVLLRAQVDF